LHYHNEVLWKQTTETETFCDDAMKKKFTQASSYAEKLKILKEQLAKKKKESLDAKAKLSMRLLTTIESYQKLGIARSYQKIINTQMDLLQLRIDAMQGEAGTEDARKNLTETLEKLRKSLTVVEEAENMPWDRSRPFQERKHWAANFMDLPGNNLSRVSIEHKYKELAKLYHSDKAGGDTVMFTKLQHAKGILLDCL
jgi:hypothetical protein